MEQNLKDYLNSNPTAKTCIIDNNFLNFCTELKRKSISVISVLKQYDVLIVPNWVNLEINDSSYRVDYLQSLSDNGIYVYKINESEYIDLANSEELNILTILLHSSHRFGAIKGFMNQYIIQKKPYEDIEYEYTDWIKMLYAKWPLSGKEIGPINNRRIQKKNAGEVSIALLAHILSYYFPKLESITLLTYDKDCYNCIFYAKDKFEKDEENMNFRNRDHASITFKSNDFIFYELVQRNAYDINTIRNVIDEVRTLRHVKYSRKKEDNSFEDRILNVDNSKLIDLLSDVSLHIIF